MIGRTRGVPECRDLAHEGADPVVESGNPDCDPGTQAVTPQPDRRRSRPIHCERSVDRVAVPACLDPEIDLTPRIAVTRAMLPMVERQDRQAVLTEPLGLSVHDHRDRREAVRHDHHRGGASFGEV